MTNRNIVVFVAVVLAASVLVSNTSEARSKNVAIDQVDGRVDTHSIEIVKIKWAIRVLEKRASELEKAGKDKDASRVNYESAELRNFLSKLQRQVELDAAARKRLGDIVTQYGEAIAELQKESQAARTDIDGLKKESAATRSDISDIRRQVRETMSGLDELEKRTVRVIKGVQDEVEAVDHKVDRLGKKKQDRLRHELLASAYVDMKDYGPAVDYNLLIPASEGWGVGLGSGLGYASNGSGLAFLFRLFGQKEFNDYFGLRFGAAATAETKASTGAVRGSNLVATLGPVFHVGGFVVGLDVGGGVERSADGEYVLIEGSGLEQRQTQNGGTFFGRLYLGGTF